jgi:hypothetical protein
MSPPDRRAKAYANDNPSPVPWPAGLVLKNGSKTRSARPDADARVADGHGDRSPGRFSVRTVSTPPAGIASRALIARFRTASASRPGSTSIGHTSRSVT